MGMKKKETATKQEKIDTTTEPKTETKPAKSSKKRQLALIPVVKKSKYSI